MILRKIAYICDKISRILLKAVESNFLKFVQGPKQFKIPIYQRPYSWSIKQCEQLWNDILGSAIDKTIQGHFIGSIVYIQGEIYQSGAISELVVIDGQQRLTTLILLLKAISNHIRELNIEGPNSSKRINNYYLINNDEDNPDLRPKLILTKGDRETLGDLIQDRAIESNEYNKILQNYQFFREQIAQSKIDINEILNGINKLFIVDISLERDKDNPQLIFESLNSTGLELSQADLIRNFILMRLDSKEQERIYDEYWFPMEKEFEVEDYDIYFNRFMRDYLTIQLERIPNMSDVYSEFKTYISSRNNNFLEIIKKIRQYSKLFSNLVYAKDEDDDIKQVIKDINELRVEVSYPFSCKFILTIKMEQYQKTNSFKS